MAAIPKVWSDRQLLETADLFQHSLQAVCRGRASDVVK